MTMAYRSQIDLYQTLLEGRNLYQTGLFNLSEAQIADLSRYLTDKDVGTITSYDQSFYVFRSTFGSKMYFSAYSGLRAGWSLNPSAATRFSTMTGAVRWLADYAKSYDVRWGEMEIKKIRVKPTTVQFEVVDL